MDIYRAMEDAENELYEVRYALGYRYLTLNEMECYLDLEYGLICEIEQLEDEIAEYEFYHPYGY